MSRPGWTHAPDPPGGARGVALQVVSRTFDEGAYTDRAFRAAAADLDRRDRALAMEIAYGTVRQRRLLDHGIELLGGRSVGDLDPPVRSALRIGAYQLAFLDSVPAHAAVNEAVELVRRCGLERAVPLTNAVMRKLAGGLERLIGTLGTGSAPAAALRYSYPDWIARAWWEQLGAAAACALMEAQNRAAEIAVRVNTRKTDELPGRRDPSLPAARVVDSVPEGWIRDGLAMPQSRASQLAGLCVGAGSGDRTLDVCAAPGGKATQVPGEVVAVEAHAGRARELEATVRRLGATNVAVVRADARALPPALSGFDRALVDAPCSGLGVLAARPDLRWRARPLPDLQLQLLQAAAQRVRPGGTLTYAVCTINAEENEAVVDALGLEPDDLGAVWPRYRHAERPRFLLTRPDRDSTSGFFVARVRC